MLCQALSSVGDSGPQLCFPPVPLRPPPHHRGRQSFQKLRLAHRGALKAPLTWLPVHTVHGAGCCLGTKRCSGSPFMLSLQGEVKRVERGRNPACSRGCITGLGSAWPLWVTLRGCSLVSLRTLPLSLPGPSIHQAQPAGSIESARTPSAPATQSVVPAAHRSLFCCFHYFCSLA